MTKPVALVRATVVGLLLAGCGAPQVENCPPVGAHAGNLVEVGGGVREIEVSYGAHVSVTAQALEWKAQTVVALPPLPSPASNGALVSLREKGGQLVRRVIVTDKPLTNPNGQRVRRLLEQVARFYELPETNLPLPEWEALHQRTRLQARQSVADLLDLVTRAQQGDARVLNAQTLGVLDGLVAGVEHGVVGFDRCVSEARTRQPLLPAQTWSTLSTAAATVVVVGTALASVEDARLEAGVQAWSPAAILIALDLLTTGEQRGWDGLSLSSASLEESLRRIRDKTSEGTFEGHASRARRLCGYYFGEELSRWKDPSEGCGACDPGEICVDSVCRSLPSSLSCENRCCVDGEVCPAAVGSCFCDALCMELDDCCGDFTAACVD